MSLCASVRDVLDISENAMGTTSQPQKNDNKKLKRVEHLARKAVLTSKEKDELLKLVNYFSLDSKRGKAYLEWSQTVLRQLDKQWCGSQSRSAKRSVEQSRKSSARKVMARIQEIIATPIKSPIFKRSSKKSLRSGKGRSPSPTSPLISRRLSFSPELQPRPPSSPRERAAFKRRRGHENARLRHHNNLKKNFVKAASEFETRT